MTQEGQMFSDDRQWVHEQLQKIKEEIGKVIVGQTALVDGLLIGLLCNGHLLLEGVPGIAKTLAANTLAKVVRAQFKRIQFTPDLLPADLIGTLIYNLKEGVFEVKKGPVFTNILLADEINRAPAKVQSALLEIMQEKQVTIGGETFDAPVPFLVLATQNPIEQEGTYPLAEAQADRFMMKIKIDYPSHQEEKLILERMGCFSPASDIKPIMDLDSLAKMRKMMDSIYIEEKVIDYLLHIVESTRHPESFSVPITKLLEYGASPRGSLSLKLAAKAKAFLQGRLFVVPQDIKDVAHAVLRHRIKLSYEAEAENLNPDDIIDKILHTLPVP